LKCYCCKTTQSFIDYANSPAAHLFKVFSAGDGWAAAQQKIFDRYRKETIVMQTDWEITEAPGKSSVALGFFDGVHLAHAAVIRAAVGGAPEGALPTVLSFKSIPDSKAGARVILPLEQRLARFEALGVQRAILPDFAQVAQMDPEAFFQEILVDKLHAALLSCGYDYTFGKNAAGDAGLLQKLCAREGIRLVVLPPFARGGSPVSATRIRHLLAEGDIPGVNALLGYQYYILGKIIHGKHLGRVLGFPTLNQRLEENQALPKFGVYNSTTEVLGRVYKSVTNIGVKPSIEGDRAPLAETYLLDANADFYGQTAQVFLLEMTRPEQKFPSLEVLRSTVLHDISVRRER